MKSLCEAQFSYKCLAKAEFTSGELYGRAICCKNEAEARELLHEIERVLRKKFDVEDEFIRKLILRNIGVWSSFFPQEDQSRVQSLFNIKPSEVFQYGKNNDSPIGN